MLVGASLVPGSVVDVVVVVLVGVAVVASDSESVVLAVVVIVVDDVVVVLPESVEPLLSPGSPPQADDTISTRRSNDEAA
ncbi:hypothetical protein [Nannocystis pusilla]|uniref:hypothetical protein n=1 Tax=Nannocystis pusilla TaxID=889268 RepID=UPI003DA47966